MLLGAFLILVNARLRCWWDALMEIHSHLSDRVFKAHFSRAESWVKPAKSSIQHNGAWGWTQEFGWQQRGIGVSCVASTAACTAASLWKVCRVLQALQCVQHKCGSNAIGSSDARIWALLNLNEILQKREYSFLQNNKEFHRTHRTNCYI